jgi:hypothetical protein
MQFNQVKQLGLSAVVALGLIGAAGGLSTGTTSHLSQVGPDAESVFSSDDHLALHDQAGPPTGPWDQSSFAS